MRDVFRGAPPDLLADEVLPVENTPTPFDMFQNIQNQELKNEIQRKRVQVAQFLADSQFNMQNEQIVTDQNGNPVISFEYRHFVTPTTKQGGMPSRHRVQGRVEGNRFVWTKANGRPFENEGGIPFVYTVRTWEFVKDDIVAAVAQNVTP